MEISSRVRAARLAKKLCDAVLRDDGVGEGAEDALAVDSRLVDVQVIDWMSKGGKGGVKGA